MLTSVIESSLSFQHPLRSFVSDCNFASPFFPPNSCIYEEEKLVIFCLFLNLKGHSDNFPFLFYFEEQCEVDLVLVGYA